jgi:hypothetical protein
MTPANIFGAALERLNPSNRFSELPKPQIQRFGAKTEPRESANDDEPHKTSRRYSGFGLDGKAWVHCTCGWSGPEREQSDDFMSIRLMGDERNHREESRCIERSDLARACDVRQARRGNV